MPSKLIAALLVFAVTLVIVAPPRVSAQGPSTAATVPSEQDFPATPAKAKSDLKGSLAVAVAKAKASLLTESDLKRLEQEQHDQQSGAPASDKWSRKKKLLVALLIVVAAGAFVVAYKHRCKDQPGKPCPEIDSTDSYSDY